MTQITVTIELDDELSDPDDDTGLTEDAFNYFMDAINEFGEIVDGPNRT